MTDAKTACIQFDKRHLDSDVTFMEQWFAKSGQWVFKFMPGTKQYITSSLEDKPVSERNEKNALNAVLHTEDGNVACQQQKTALQAALDLFYQEKPVRLVSFVGQLRMALNSADFGIDGNQQAIWAIKIDPLIRWLREHSSDKNSSDQVICENRAITLFEEIAGDITTKTPPWIVPFRVSQSKDDWFLIPHKNESFMFNLENALWFVKEKLLSNRLLSVQEFIRPKPNDDKSVVIKMII